MLELNHTLLSGIYSTRAYGMCCDIAFRGAARDEDGMSVASLRFAY